MKKDWTDLDSIIMDYDSGMMLLGDWEIIHKYAKSKQKKVELGTANGLTTILIARSGSLRSFDSELIPEGETYTIDQRDDQELTAYLKRFGIKVICGDTADSALLFDDGSVDFLLIDASHTHEGVKRDFYAWLPKMKTGAPILFHDMDRICEEHAGVWRLYTEDLENEMRTGCLKEVQPEQRYTTRIKVFVKL